MNDAREFHVDGFLSSLVTGFKPTGFIADQILPRVTVGKQSNIYATIPKGNWFKVDVADRAPGTLANEITYTVGSDTYFCPNYELRHKVTAEAIDNADSPFRPRQKGAEFLVTKHELGYEVRVERTVAAGVGSSTTLTGGDAWSDFTNSDPMGDIEVAQNAIQYSTGLDPNLGVMGRRTWQKLRRHPDIVQRVFPGGAGGGTVSLAQFGELIGVPKILIGTTIKNTGAEGGADTFTDVWSSNFHLFYVDPNPSGDQVATFGLSFLWTGPTIGMKSPGNWMVERKYDDDIKAEWVRTGYYQDEKIVAPELGFTIRTGI
jgi:hypothetical protein